MRFQQCNSNTLLSLHRVTALTFYIFDHRRYKDVVLYMNQQSLASADCTGVIFVSGPLCGQEAEQTRLKERTSLVFCAAGGWGI